MVKQYKNAKKVLPPELLAEVQEYCDGLLYVPRSRQDQDERNRLMRKCLSRGVTPSEIAQITGLTLRRVQQVRAAMETDGRETDFTH